MADILKLLMNRSININKATENAVDGKTAVNPTFGNPVGDPKKKKKKKISVDGDGMSASLKPRKTLSSAARSYS